jgi:hypothetical protein
MTLDIVGTTQTWAEALTADWVEEGSDEGPHFRFRGFFPRAISTTSREEERSVGQKTGRMNINQSVPSQKLKLNYFNKLSYPLNLKQNLLVWCEKHFERIIMFRK